MKILIEFKVENMMSVKTIEQKIWEVFNMLRNELLASEEYYIVLFLLSIYKDGIFSKEFLFNKANVHEDLVLRIRNADENVRKQYLQIFQSFESDLKRISSIKLVSIFQILSNIDKNVLSENFSEIFDNVLYQITKSQGKPGGEFIQPIELTRLICTIADLPEKSKIFNPFAGLASFGIFLNQEHNYLGQEINQKTWALGTLRLMAHEKLSNSHFMCVDSISHWPKESDKFDLIVANPPYRVRLSQQHRKVHPNILTVRHFLIEKGLNSLNTKGKLIALLPQSFLFGNTQEKHLVAHLIEGDLIDTIISLPGGLLLNTGIPLIVLIINKNKKLPGKVRLIDAKTFVKLKSTREKILNDYALIRVVQDSYKKSEVVRLIDNSLIRKFDYNLNVSRYFQKNIEGKKLKELVEFVKGTKKDIPNEGKMVRIKDLKDDKLNFKLDISQVEKTKFYKPSNWKWVNESCLLIAKRWKTLKPTLFEFAGEGIILSDDILSFRINDQLIDTAYLVNELHADYVKEQLETYRQGGTIPTIRLDDLLEIVIKLPSLEEQRAKIQGIRELSDEIKILQRERDAIAHGKETKQFNEFASLKHTLGRPRQNILDWTDNLLHFFSDNPEGFEALNKAFHDFYETDIISALQEMKRDVNFMTDVLEKGENGFVVEEYDTTIIPLSEVNNLVNGLSSNCFNFKIKKLLLEGEMLNKRGIQGNKILLKTLIDNILTNAHKYGFPKKEAGNEVIFELKEIDDFLSIEVRNNGKPFPRNFDRDKFITKYSTADSKSGSGLGGYDIHRIATAFNNPEWELFLNEDPIYPVKFKFQFPIKLIN